MKTCERMQRVITQIASTHDLDLTAETAQLRLVMESLDPLVITKVGKYLVSVAHHFDLAGEATTVPEVVFFTGYQSWIPIEITEVRKRKQYASLSEDGSSIVGVDPRGQAELVDFAEMWARNIEAQGWLEYAHKWVPRPPQPEPPDLETLQMWLWEDGGCEAACPYGCWVEPDGHCEHSKPSWLLVMGLI